MSTNIIMYNSQDSEIARVRLSDEDATVNAIARAAVDIIQSCGAMSVGDKIVVEED